MNLYSSILREIESSHPNIIHIAELMRQEDFDINEIQQSFSLLHWAIAYNQEEVCQLFLETEKIQQNILDISLSSALNNYLSYPQTRYVICEMLLKAKAKPYDDFIIEIIFFILEKDFIEGMKILELFLIYGANPTNAIEAEHGYNLLTKTIQLSIAEPGQKNFEMRKQLFELLLKYKCNPEFSKDNGRTALMGMAQEGAIELAQILINYGADITLEDKDGILVLNYASSVEIESFFLQTLKDLYGEEITNLTLKNMIISLDSDNNVGNDQEKALLKAVLKKNTDQVAQLLAENVNPDFKDPSGTPILCYAAERNFVYVMSQLLDAGAEVNISTNTIGNTPLHMATKLESAKLLISRGANLEAKNNLGETVLYTAIKNNMLEKNIIIDLLLQEGVDPNEPAYRNQTALHKAILTDQVALIQILLDYQANIDAQDIYGKTPLHRAVQKENRKAIEVLLKNGANPGIRCLLGKAAWDYPYVPDHLKTLLLKANEEYEKNSKKKTEEEVEASNEKRARVEDNEQAKVSASSSP